MPKEYTLTYREPLCLVCNKKIPSSKRFGICCSSPCEEVLFSRQEAVRKELFTTKCETCGVVVGKEKGKKNFCYACTRLKEKKRKQDLITSEEKINYWVNKKKKKGIPLEELIRRQEWKRVFDEKEWEHYLKGRKWDRI